ncbi:MAG: hypothetical protein AAF725_15345 [Acidobacteriota bacterium]
MSPDALERHLESCDPDRRDFLKSLILGTAYAAPLVTSFGMGSLGAAPADASVGSSLSNLCVAASNLNTDVVINKASARATAGEPLSYFIEVFNCGPNLATDVVIEDTLPAGTFFASSSQLEGDKTFIITEPAVGSEGGVWRAIAKGMAVGASARFEIIVDVAP